LCGPCGSPAPRRHPGARRYGYAVVNSMYTPVTSRCQYFFWQQIQSSLLSRLPFAKFEKSCAEACIFSTLRPLQRSTKNDRLLQEFAYSYRGWITLIKLPYAPLQYLNIDPDIHQGERLCGRLLPSVLRVSEKNSSETVRKGVGATLRP